MNLDKHNISLVVHGGAVTKTVEVECGVLVSGPFRFPRHTLPVSVILWFGTKSKKSISFSKPIEIRLPHFIDHSSPLESDNLVFVTASHDSFFSDKPFIFTEVGGDVNIDSTKGYMHTKNFGFYTLVHRQPRRALEKINYCIMRTTPRTTESNFEMNYCIVHSLKTCTEVRVDSSSHTFYCHFL